ncbi:MAG: hypothetical protein GYB64_16670 [Chloroflexi bacterium]|nr:hypothetical protein [Chloroflexota bacterium]
MRRFALIVPVLILMAAALACAGGTSNLCSTNASGVRSCNGTIASLNGSTSIDIGDSLMAGQYAYVVTVTVDSGSVDVSFVDADGAVVSGTASAASPLTLSGQIAVTSTEFEQGRVELNGTAEGLTYQLTAQP